MTNGINENWTIFPKQGLGSIRFGMRSSEIDRLSDTYGKKEKSADARIPDSILQETLDKFGSALTDEQRAGLLELYREQGPAESLANESRNNGALTFEFDSDRLVAATILPRLTELNLEGQRLFEVPPIEVMKLLERLNGEPGLFIANSAFFDKILVYVDGFTEVAEGKSILVFGKPDSDKDASIMIRRHSYFPNDVSPQLIAHSFLN